MQISFEDHIKKLGGEGILNKHDIGDLRSSVRRVYELMSDHMWHTADEICQAAGTGGRPAREGLRRMRELRDYGFFIDRTRDGDSRNWLYRLCDRAA